MTKDQGPRTKDQGPSFYARMLNAVRCYVSYALSPFGSVRITHMPLFVSVEPAAVCQLHCPACPVGRSANDQRPTTKYMPYDLWQRVLQETAPYVHTMQFYFQGEPLLHQALPQMIAEAHACGLYTVVSTNAQALTESLAEALVASGLNRIIISMDGLTEESYNAYRMGGSLQRCKDALRFLRQAKERQQAHICIEVQCLRLRTNEHEWDTFKRQYRALGADRLVFKTAQLYDYAHGHPLMPSDERYSRYVQGADGHYHRKPIRRGCLRVWKGCVITTTGEVLPCCYDKGRAYSYGNIKNASLRQLFNSPQAHAFRTAALQHQPDICSECWQ